MRTTHGPSHQLLGATPREQQGKGYPFVQLYPRSFADFPNPQEAQRFLRTWNERFPHRRHRACVRLFFLPKEGVPLLMQDHHQGEM